jgi:phage-related protein
MHELSKKISVSFFISDTGREPVREWLLSLQAADRKIVGEDIKTVEFGWPSGLPVCRPLGNGLYEVRSTLTSGVEARVLFNIFGNEMILLHGFIKKGQKTPTKDLKTAKRRLMKFKRKP